MKSASDYAIGSGVNKLNVCASRTLKAGFNCKTTFFAEQKNRTKMQEPHHELQGYKQELQNELSNILRYWQSFAVDVQNGGFVGKIDNDNRVEPKATKGSVLNSRILWSFSAAYNLARNVQYLQMAERAFKYIRNYFVDKDHGGVFWTVDYRGNPLDTKKQVYALAFAVYGLTEYYRASEEPEAKKLAVDIYNTIVKHSYDETYGGYIEALSRDWKDIDDLRLSDKDANEKKSMNTHLHVLEAFANLYRIWPDAKLKLRITELVNIFLEHIIDPVSNHLILFFDEKWSARSNVQSFGHDIEAAWLVQEAAEIIQDHALGEQVKHRMIAVADAAARGLDKDGGLWYELDLSNNHLVKEKHWWPQAEAMVGFYNAWQVTGKANYLEASMNAWRFTKTNLLNREKGEWYWGVDHNNEPLAGYDKVGLWKCPYHNSRACIELIQRINK